MPIYKYECPYCLTKEEKMVPSFSQKDKQVCSFCELPTEYQMSFRFNATGLPNGFASTKGASLIKKDIGKADDK